MNGTVPITMPELFKRSMVAAFVSASTNFASPKIEDLQLSLLVDHDVRRFDVAMNYALRMLRRGHPLSGRAISNELAMPGRLAAENVRKGSS